MSFERTQSLSICNGKKGMNLKKDTVETILSARVAVAFRTAWPEADAAGVPFDVVAAAEERFGDYQCNAAMGLARHLRANPRAIAQRVVEQLPADEWIERVEIAGAGFINLFLRSEQLAAHLQAVAACETLPVPPVGEGQTVVLDYSSPNVAKPMHIGHIRSTVIGNALDRLHRRLGYRVVADNHLGDWGTQFGLLIMGYHHFADQAALQTQPVEELERIYVKSYERSQEDAAWLDQARAELVKLQQGDADHLALWQHFVDLSLGEFDRIYRRLDVQFDLHRGESFYRDQLADVVAVLSERGLTEESEGALIVRLEEEKLPPCIVRKRDGGFNYATSDLATVRSRMEEFAPDKVVYVTDERQQLHFSQFFAIARRAGWQVDLEHVWFGLMRLPEATFSTRQGNVIKLERLLDEAESRALALVQASSPEMPEAQQREVARAVGIGAVKYADLSQNPQSMITFTWDKALAMDGNSAPYLQYAYARIASVRDKYRERFPGQDPADWPIVLEEPVERRLALRLLRYPAAVQRAAALYRPSALADYLYDLAQTYSSFYQNVPFLKAPEGQRESRVQLCELVARTLRDGLQLLGIETPDRI
jgi:arginyl-tRNA synthetase